ncbi:MAG: hypothetical protein DRJ65_07995 [Acidobacteria bacterium]|nr:MAG: hypothetical protein DRJ65_07995 [Acidobacteriota bacterium]
MTAAVYLLIALFATTGGVQIGAAVVCVGADGHIDVESFFDGCCSPAAPDDHGAGVNVVMNGSACGDCVDVQLRVVPIRTRKGSLASPGIAAGIRSIISRCGAGTGGHHAVFRDLVDRNSQSLTLLSTVILLT